MNQTELNERPAVAEEQPTLSVQASARLWQRLAPQILLWWRRLRWPILALISGAYLKDILFRIGLTSALTGMLGAQVSVGSASLSLLKQGVAIHRLEVAQPKGFSDGKLVQIRDVRVRVDVPALLHGQIHLPELTLKVQEVHVIRDAQKRLNVDALKVSQAPKEAAAQPRFKIDRATLSVDRLVYTDYTKAKSGQPKVEVFDRPVKEKTFENIRSIQQLALAVLSNAIGPAALKSAGIMGAATIAGVGLLPIGILTIVVAKDSASQTFMMDSSRVFDKTQEFLRQTGELKQVDKAKGMLEASVQGHRVRVSLKELPGRMTQVTLTARKLLIPKPSFAAGLLYQLDQRIDD